VWFQFSDEVDDAPVMARFIETSSIELADPAGSWIQAFPYVEYDHPVHGKIKFDEQRAQRMAANVSAGVRGQDLDVDYDHKALRGDAAGWIKKAEARSDGLYIFVEWTKEALGKLKEKAYRYFSPEYTDSWKHPDGRMFQDVLWGGALTNRPFLKGITPINLSEMVGSGSEETPPRSEGGNQVNRQQLEQLATTLGVPFTDDLSDEDLFAAIDEKASTQEEPEPENEETEEETEDEPDGALIAASEAQLKKLAETNPAVQTMLDERNRQRKQLAKLENAHRLSEVKVALAEIDTKDFALTPKAKDKVKALAIKLSESASDDLMELVKDIVKDGIVQLGELGGRPKDDDSITLGDPSDFDKAVIKLMEADKDLSIGDAVEQVSRDHPELAEAHRQGSYANDELRGDR
jgi:hypothetical protein